MGAYKGGAGGWEDGEEPSLRALARLVAAIAALGVIAGLFEAFRAGDGGCACGQWASGQARASRMREAQKGEERMIVTLTIWPASPRSRA